MTGPNGRSTTAAIATTKTFYFSHCLAHRCRTASSVTRSTLPPKWLMTSCDTAASCISLYAAAACPARGQVAVHLARLELVLSDLADLDKLLLLAAHPSSIAAYKIQLRPSLRPTSCIGTFRSPSKNVGHMAPGRVEYPCSEDNSRCR